MIARSLEQIEPDSVAVIGLRPSQIMPGTVESLVSLRSDADLATILYMWQNEENVGVAAIGDTDVARMPFHPVSETEFVGYHIGMAQSARFTIRHGADSSITRLTFPDANLTATRRQ